MAPQETGAAKLAESKLQENLKKLQVVSLLKGKNSYGWYIFSLTTIQRMSMPNLFVTLEFWQGINIRTTEMQDKAKSFSLLANQVLRTEQDKRNQ